MSRRRSGGSCCCAIPGCIIVEDDFDRGDNADIGDKFVEILGTWAIDTNQLTEVGTPNAIVVTVAQNTSGRGYVSAFIEPVEGSKYRLLLGAKSDGTEYQFVEAHCTAAALVLTAGGETRTYTAADDGWSMSETPIGMSACLTQGLLWVHVSHMGFGGCVWDNTATVNNANRHAGMMNGGSTELKWDDFVYQQHYLDDPECPNPGCYCEYEDDDGHTQRYYLGWQMMLTYIGYPGCDCFTGCVTMEYDCAEAAWFAVSGVVCSVSLPSGTGIDRVPKVTCGYDVRCDWLMSQFTCCDGAAPASGCDTPPSACVDQGADSFVCGPADTFAVRWYWEVPETDLSCAGEIYSTCGEYGGSYDAILTDGACP